MIISLTRRRRPRPLKGPLPLLAFACLPACTGGSDVTAPGALDPDAPPRPNAIEIATSSTSFSYLGETISLSATVLDQHGATMEGQSVTWRSLAPSIITVSSDGTAEAQANGTATLEAGAGDVTASLTLSVEQLAASLQVVPQIIRLEHPGLEASFLASARDAHGDPAPLPPLSWRVTDGEVARVNEAGRVTALGPGQTAIVVEGGRLSAAALLEVGSP